MERRISPGMWWALAATSSFVIACSGDAGPAGPAGSTGPQGPTGPAGTAGQPGDPGTPGLPGTDGSTGTPGMNGTNGTNGTNGEDGKNGGNVEIPNFHGTDFVFSSDEYAEGKFLAEAAITAASADAAGKVSIDFTVSEPNGDPVVDVPSVSANIVKLMPPATGESFTRWEPYIYRTETAAAGNWPNPAGTEAPQGYRESDGILTNHGDGSYTYEFATNISNVVMPVTDKPIVYERNRTHRVSVMMGGHDGATATAHLDFVPDGSVVTLTRNIIQTTACKACHGDEFAGHGGDRVSVENCVTCHNSGSLDAQGGETLDFKVMIHKIHAGGELQSIPGPDGIVWNDPSTPVDESADNGEYAIWGYRNSKHEWWKVEFPAVIENCEKCHQGTGDDVDAWREVPSREACGSCHDLVDFETGTGHNGAAQENDDFCAATCHRPSGDITPPAIFPVPAVHKWFEMDPRNIPEFEAELSISDPANGSYFEAGEAPVVTVVLKENGTALDHTTIVQGSAQGCLEAGCPPRDGAFATTNFFVHGPRASRNPVLTSVARNSGVVAPTVGPFNLSAAGASIEMIVDGGGPIRRVDSSGGDLLYSGDITVTVASGTFANVAAATPQEIVDWLNGNTNFTRRAIAYLDGGRPAVRSRNLGKFYTFQLVAGAVTTAVFGGDTTIHAIGGYYPANRLYQYTNPANNDPKVSWFTDRIEYQLDPVDDLTPGTYLVGIEISDRGRVNNDNYQTPTVGKLAFQVKQADEEPPPAMNCDRCHQGPDGNGFVLDYARHNKIFDHNAVDQCGQCHDYQNLNVTGEWAGAGAITRRVHGVHNGSNLNYPLQTVGYSNGDPVKGRNWDIEFPMDIRNCQACHPDGESSGSWAFKAARLPCYGCHDSDPAQAHMRLMTWDPTPADPWNGDEEESCMVCH